MNIIAVPTTGRKIHTLADVKKQTQSWLDNWQLLPAAGLPALATVRTSRENTLLIANHCSNGEEGYGKTIFIHLGELAREKGELIFREINKPLYQLSQTKEIPLLIK